MKNKMGPALVLSLSLAGCASAKVAALQVVMVKDFDRVYPVSLQMVAP
jgi:hypothetical protein